MKFFAVTCMVFAACLACADVREVTGYGSGDDLAQAIAAARVDAILNAGGKMSVESEAKHEKLVRDGGKSENEAFLISYDVTEKGESFDGTYVRIKAKVSKDESDYTLKDGCASVAGEGVASDSAEAEVRALLDAVIKSGAKIKAVVKYENDELVEDDSTLNAQGFISSYEVAKGGADGSVVAKCKILKDESKLELPAPIELSGVGSGDNAAFAEAVARRQMLLGHGSEFVIHAAYKNGSQTTFTAERTRAASVASVKAFTDATGNEKTTVRVSAIVSNKSLAAVPDSAAGLGYGKDVIAAHEAALCDAIVNRTSHIEISVSYDKGHETGCSTEYTGSCNYIGEDFKATARAEGGFVCETMVKTAAALPDVAADIAQTVEAVGFGRNKLSAINDAKRRAVDMVFGSEVTVNMREQDGRVTKASCRATHSEKGYVDKCDVVSTDSNTGTTVVTIRAVVRNHDGDSSGWGWITVICVILALSALFMGAKKLGAVAFVIVWILSAAGLFVMGHWAVGIAAVFLGIGALQAD